MPCRTPESLRSQRWFAPDTMRAFAHRQRTQQMGRRREEFMGKPVIAILNTWSDLSPCHRHLRDRAEAVKRAVWAAGGYPVELPALSLGEVMVKPTTMLYRNMLAIEAEELLRQHPVDGAVLMGGCDKTTPGLIMGALSMGLPFLFCPAGPMLNGRWRGERAGAGTHTKKYWDAYRTGDIDQADWIALESAMTRSVGTCNTMGTASTMTSIVEAMGLTLPGASSIPAADAGHERMCSAAGEHIVEMVWHDRAPHAFLTRESFLNGAAVMMALGGSTNAAVHIMALARRAGVDFTLDDLDRLGREVPVLANIFPSGDRLMEDFFFAGGLPALMVRIAPHLHLGERTVTGGTLAEAVKGAEVLDDEVIRPPERPVSDAPAIAVLRGNLAPAGAVIKPSAADPARMVHTGPAVVFSSMADFTARIDDPDLPVTADSVLVLQNAGPVGAPGMPEWGNLQIPKKLLEQGVRDMVRLSDARMSGTHYGTCVLHIAPEAAVGGPLAFVRDGDQITLDVPARRLSLDVDEVELTRRRTAWTPPDFGADRGWVALHRREVTQASEGCDFPILERGRDQGEPEIF